MFAMLFVVVFVALFMGMHHIMFMEGEEYTPTMLDEVYRYTQVNYLPEWAMYGGTCKYTRSTLPRTVRAPMRTRTMVVREWDAAQWSTHARTKVYTRVSA